MSTQFDPETAQNAEEIEQYVTPFHRSYFGQYTDIFPGSLP